MRPHPPRRRPILAALVSALVTALCLTGFAAPPAAAATLPPLTLAWGSNNFGQIGDGTTTNRLTPVDVHVPAGVQFVAVSSGSQHNLALTADHRVYAWGRNNYGQVGISSAAETINLPTPVTFPGNPQIAAVMAGAYHSLAMTTDGRVYAWGYNFNSQVGDGTTTNRTAPVPVTLPAGTHAVALAAGTAHSLALLNDGRWAAWGLNTSGQFGNGTTANSSTPIAVNPPAGLDFVALTCGFYFTLGKTADGRVYGWGTDNFGQIGDGTTGTNRLVPTETLLPEGSTAVAIAAGNSFGMGLLDDGRVFTWGHNNMGQLGDGTLETRPTPVPVELPAGVRIAAIDGGNSHSLALSTEGRVYDWGLNSSGQLGDDSTTNSSLPVAVQLPATTHVTFISAAGYNNVVLADESESAVTLAANPALITVGGTVQLTATVTCTTNTPTGTVEFLDGSTSLGTAVLDAAGTATLPMSTLSVGTHAVTAHYLGGGTCPAAVSEAATVTVNQAASSTTLTASPSTALPGQQVTLTAHVSCPGGAPTGTVQFFQGSAPIGTGPVDASGDATLTLTGLSPGIHQFTAQYEGNTNCSASTSEAATVTVTTGATAVTLTATPSTAGPGEPVTLTAYVACLGATPTGTVVFLGPSGAIGSATVDASGNAVLVVSDLPVGTHEIRALYQGSPSCSMSASEPVTVTITQTPESTTTLTASPVLATPVEVVTLTAHVTCTTGAPTGTVEFLEGSTSLGTAPVDSFGNAVLFISGLPVGSHQITAHYLGSGACPPSVSAPVTVTISVVPESLTTLTALPDTAAVGQPVTLVAHVDCTTGTPTGTVEFFDGTTSLGTATLDPKGNALIVTAGLAVGTHQITAHYEGDPVCPPSTSAPVTVTVTQAPQGVLTLAKAVSTPGPYKAGDTVEYTYTATNTGSTELHGVTVTDNRVAQVSCSSTTLAPGQSTSCHGSYTVRLADTPKSCRTDVANGHAGGSTECPLTNRATATATDPSGTTVTSTPARVTICVEVPHPRRLS